MKTAMEISEEVHRLTSDQEIVNRRLAAEINKPAFDQDRYTYTILANAAAVIQAQINALCWVTQDETQTSSLIDGLSIARSTFKITDLLL